MLVYKSPNTDDLYCYIAGVFEENLVAEYQVSIKSKSGSMDLDFDFIDSIMFEALYENPHVLRMF